MDTFTAETRSRIMSRIRSKDTKPELAVRRMLHGMGYRFRLHRKDLRGKPDIVLPKYRTAIFVHGCFWHSHSCMKGRRPASNAEFWNDKFSRNKRRDAANLKALRAAGWQCLVLWECHIRDSESLHRKLATALPKRHI
jgi:DNA mismatch endonuclease (patch repair protein)